VDEWLVRAERGKRRFKASMIAALAVDVVAEALHTFGGPGWLVITLAIVGIALLGAAAWFAVWSLRTAR
jgi:hypothetical protein